MSDQRNRCFGKAVLAEGSAANEFKTTTNTITYTIKGKAYTKAPTDGFAMTAGTTQPAYSKCAYGVLLDTSGNATTIQGPIKTFSSAATYSAESVLPLPENSNPDKCLIGYIVIQTAATTFTAASTDIGAANITESFVDCDGDAPQTVILY